MKQPRALLVDLDNTLVDRDHALQSWLHTLALPVETLDALIVSDGGGYGDRRAFFAQLAALLDVSVTAIRHRFLRELPRHTRLKPDADALLRAFAGPIVVVTNGPSALQRGKLAAAGLVGRVAGVVVSGELGVRKPDAAIFARALALADCAAGDALMVGDHPAFDLAGARAAGIDGVFVRTRWFAAPAGCRAISQLSELCA